MAALDSYLPKEFSATRLYVSVRVAPSPTISSPAPSPPALTTARATSAAKIKVSTDAETLFTTIVAFLRTPAGRQKPHVIQDVSHRTWKHFKTRYGERSSLASTK